MVRLSHHSPFPIPSGLCGMHSSPSAPPLHSLASPPLPRPTRSRQLLINSSEAAHPPCLHHSPIHRTALVLPALPKKFNPFLQSSYAKSFKRLIYSVPGHLPSGSNLPTSSPSPYPPSHHITTHNSHSPIPKCLSPPPEVLAKACQHFLPSLSRMSAKSRRSKGAWEAIVPV